MGGAAKALVASCPASQRHQVRYVGASEPTAVETMYLVCPK
jgi:hypothetical protein